MVLAMGTLMDLDLPPHSVQAMEYYQVARATLSLDSVLEEQTVVGVQALVRSSFDVCTFLLIDLP